MTSRRENGQRTRHGGRRGGQRGQGFADLAFVMVALAFFLAGAAEFGRIFYWQQKARAGAEAGALYAANPQDLPGCTPNCGWNPNTANYNQSEIEMAVMGGMGIAADAWGTGFNVAFLKKVDGNPITVTVNLMNDPDYTGQRRVDVTVSFVLQAFWSVWKPQYTITAKASQRVKTII